MATDTTTCTWRDPKRRTWSITVGGVAARQGARVLATGPIGRDTPTAHRILIMWDDRCHVTRTEW